MPSQPQSSSANDELVKDITDKRSSEWTFTSGATGLTYGEREDERDAISLARPGGLARVVSRQRLPAEGIGASGGTLRNTLAVNPRETSAQERASTGEDKRESNAKTGKPAGEARG